MTTKQLDERSIDYTRDFEYVTEGDKRVRKELDVITHVHLPLSSDEWCSLCTHDGDYYMGGCCGNMSALQDILNGAFRDSGLFNARTLRQVADLCLGHEGFEDFEDPFLFDKPFDELDPFQKLGLIWQASKDLLQVGKWDVPQESDLTEYEEAIRLASSHTMRLGWGSFFASANKDKDQTRCNSLHHQARLLAALRTIYDYLKKSDDTFAGWGLRNVETKNPAEDYFGLCLFETKEKVENLIETLRRNDDFVEEEWEITPFIVSVQKGLVWNKHD